jgi:hypothetical protein
MKQRFRLFRRGTGGRYYIHDGVAVRQKALAALLLRERHDAARMKSWVCPSSAVRCVAIAPASWNNTIPGSRAARRDAAVRGVGSGALASRMTSPNFRRLDAKSSGALASIIQSDSGRFRPSRSIAEGSNDPPVQVCRPRRCPRYSARDSTRVRRTNHPARAKTEKRSYQSTPNLGRMVDMPLRKSNPTASASTALRGVASRFRPNSTRRLSFRRKNLGRQ